MYVSIYIYLYIYIFIIYRYICIENDIYIWINGWMACGVGTPNKQHTFPVCRFPGSGRVSLLTKTNRSRGPGNCRLQHWAGESAENTASMYIYIYIRNMFSGLGFVVWEIQKTLALGAAHIYEIIWACQRIPVWTPLQV
jgi:hypothetical protein